MDNFDIYLRQARAYRSLGNIQSSVKAYHRYLHQHPHPQDFDDVEEELQIMLSQASVEDREQDPKVEELYELGLSDTQNLSGEITIGQEQERDVYKEMQSDIEERVFDNPESIPVYLRQARAHRV